MLEDNINIKGTLSISHYDESMHLLEKRQLNNLIVQAGKNWLMLRGIGTSKAVMSHLAVGTGTTAPTLADTGLQSQLSTRKVFDNITILNNQVTYITTLAPGQNTGALTEAGLFNASTGGDMLSRVIFSVVNKAAGDTVVIDWAIALA